jgi:hypothetical protein
MRFFFRALLIVGLVSLLLNSAYASEKEEFMQDDWCHCSLVFNDNKIVEKAFWAIDKTVANRWKSSSCKNVNTTDFISSKVKSIEPCSDKPPFRNGYPIDYKVNSINGTCRGYSVAIIYMSTVSEEKLVNAAPTTGLSSSSSSCMLDKECSKREILKTWQQTDIAIKMGYGSVVSNEKVLNLAKEWESRWGEDITK